VSDLTEFDVFWRGDVINIKEICSMSNEKRDREAKDRGRDRDEDNFKSGPAKGESKWAIVGYVAAGIVLVGLIGTWLSS
jgi:hypothetical protein